MVLIQNIDVDMINKIRAIVETLHDNFKPPSKKFGTLILRTAHAEEAMAPLLSEIMVPLVGYDETFTGRYTKFIQPIAFHIDGTLSATISSSTAVPVNTSFLIPLSIDPDDGNAHTVFFDQRDPYHPTTHHSNDEFRKHGRTGWKKSIDYSILKNYTNKPFDNLEVYEKYLSHHPIKRLYGLSVHEVVKWKVGEIMVFETNRTHCGAIFDGIVSKDCLLIKAQTDWFDDNYNHLR